MYWESQFGTGTENSNALSFSTLLTICIFIKEIKCCFQVLEQESRLPLDLTRDSSKLAGREVRIVQTRQEDEEEEEDRDKGAKCSSLSEEGKKSSSLRDGSTVTMATEEKLGGKELGEDAN